MFTVRKEEVQIFSLRLIVAFTAHSPSSLAPCRIVSDLRRSCENRYPWLMRDRNNSNDDGSLEVGSMVKHVCFKMMVVKIEKLCLAFLGSQLLYIKMWCVHHDLSTSFCFTCIFVFMLSTQ